MLQQATIAQAKLNLSCTKIFALLPPENATGNFVKVVQRVPVKIDLDDLPEALQSISPGISTEVTVTVEPPPRWLAFLL